VGYYLDLAREIPITPGAKYLNGSGVAGCHGSLTKFVLHPIIHHPIKSASVWSPRQPNIFILPPTSPPSVLALLVDSLLFIVSDCFGSCFRLFTRNHGVCTLDANTDTSAAGNRKLTHQRHIQGTLPSLSLKLTVRRLVTLISLSLK